MATAVISASEGMHYLHGIIPAIDITITTVIVLVAFTGLAILGIGESAFVAVIIFIIHLSTLSLLVVSGWFLSWPYKLSYQLSLPVTSGGIVNALFLGFSAAMLGISGFESSSNFVEEQEQGCLKNAQRN
jgi:amino acid transporter